jgi:hypothetical protein
METKIQVRRFCSGRIIPYDKSEWQEGGRVANVRI